MEKVRFFIESSDIQVILEGELMVKDKSLKLRLGREMRESEVELKDVDDLIDKWYHTSMHVITEKLIETKNTSKSVVWRGLR